MGRFTKSIVLGLAIAALCAAAAIGLDGCGNGGATGNAAAGSGPVWVVTSETQYENGEALSTRIYELDSRGSVVKSSYTNEDWGYVEYSDFTPEGYAQVQTIFHPKRDTEVRHSEITFEDGRAIAMEDEMFAHTYTYYANGRLKSDTSAQEFPDGTTYIYSNYYDENGYPTRYTMSTVDGPIEYEANCEWTFDSAGNPTGYTQTDNGSGTLSAPVEYQIQCDENGNIARIYNKQGQVVVAYEYTRIDNPSMAAWVDANTKRCYEV